MSQLFRNAVSYLSGSEGDEFIGANIDLESHQLTIKSVLGDGGFGKVYKCISMHDASEFALKRLFVPESSTKNIQQEIAFLRIVSGHANICTFMSAASHPAQRGYTEYLILLEYCPGNLSSIIKNAGTKLFSSTEVLRVFTGLCNAVQHLHTLQPPIIHRDIKAENVIFSRSGAVKLCDFGSATNHVICPNEDWNAQQRGLLEEEVQCNTTPCYRAPEMIDFYSNHEIGTKSDIWALGCFLYYICYFDLPFDDNKLAIVNAKYKTPNEHLVMFAPFLPILRGVFKCDPEQRPTAKQILQLLDNVAKDKNIDPNQPPFDDLRRRQSTAPVPTPVNNIPNNNNGRPTSWIGYLKDGAENILKEAKSASEKVVGAVVQASSLYSNEKLDEGQLTFTTVTSRIIAISFMDPHMMYSAQLLVTNRFGENAFFFNLTEHNYDSGTFNGRILNAGWSPLVPPSMTSLLRITAAMDRWLLLSSDNVLIIHCQNGTGNTALAIAAYFLISGVYKASISALQYYAASRYPNSVGIITASQKRYVEYIERILFNNITPHNHLVILCNLTLSTVPLFSVNRSNCKPFLEVIENGKKILSTLREPDVMRTYSPEDNEVQIPINMGVKGDIRVIVYHARNFIGGKMSAIRMFQLCFNTAFVDPECTSIRLPKSRLDGIARHAAKFPDPFSVLVSLSVQAESPPSDSVYSIDSSSLGITPPICCRNNEEFNKMLGKVPDKGSSKAERRATVDQRKRQMKDLTFEEEREEDQGLVSEERLIDVMSVEERQAPMSVPIVRKSPGNTHNVLLDLLDASELTLSQSSSAPNLAELDTSRHKPGPSDLFTAPPPPVIRHAGHKREKSLNLMDVSSTNEDDLINNFDMFEKREKIVVSQPKPTPTPTMLFDPFTLQPNTQPIRSASVGNNMSSLGSPLIPTRLGTGSGYNSPTQNRSRNCSPRASPSLQRKNVDPFSDLKIDPETAQMQFDRQEQQAPHAPQRPAAPPTNSTFRPNYFAAFPSSGSVFNDTKPWQVQGNANRDTFGDLLSGQNFASNESKRPQSLREQRRGELEKTTDPVQLKIMDWTAGKENNIRALLSSLGEVLWDGEVRWPKPGMHLMIEPLQVKKMYRNASRVVHPDKQVGTPNEDLAKAIQTELNLSYSEFEDAELR